MIRKMAFGLGALAAVTFAVGCDSGSSAANTSKQMDKAAKDAKAQITKSAHEAEDAAKDAKDAAKDAKSAAGDAAKAAGDAAKSTVDKGKEMAQAAADKLRDGVVKPVSDFMPKVEEKLKGLSGDTLTKAKAKYDELKKLVEEFKAAPADKMGELKDKVIAAVKELAGMVGVELPKFTS